MYIIPAIDLRGGKCVRLIQGDYHRQITYHDDPVEQAREFHTAGASWLHIVDLDAALDQGNNVSLIEEIVAKSGLAVEVGGGIRSLDYAQKLIDCGVERIVVSTKALKDQAFLEELLKRFAERVALSLDIKDGRPAINGWKHTMAVDVDNILRYLERVGLNWLIYTDISRDGTLEGVNDEGIKDMKAKVSMNLIASGGVATLGDLMKLKELAIWGAIVGKALYEKTFTLQQAIEAVS